ncbi:hypothetical protein [Acetobacter lambici]|uniref:Uncharacterized protein n=2 Tax=Acetobacter lambici TaxID=1332824 RepID=A0ABT1F3L3_9PROT|nr:hypothetical protein [Acetobacter lambici]MCP1243578.1 hypothetical protein [Acetobacter lambici]MCP1259591.1 hypothetical protein [Acetobacter lambici]
MTVIAFTATAIAGMAVGLLGGLSFMLMQRVIHNDLSDRRRVRHSRARGRFLCGRLLARTVQPDHRMTPDNEFFAIAGGAFVGLGMVLLAAVWRWRASVGNFWGQLTKGQDDAD